MNRPANEAAAEEMLRLEQAKIRKLQIIFGSWWQHYAVPYELRWTLWAERKACPYCGIALAAPAVEGGSDLDEQIAHIDHMDPLSLGGENSIRNAVYACSRCNSAKGNRLFVNWLSRLQEPHRSLARSIYVEKHGQPPESFAPGPRQPRLTLGRIELDFDESVLRRLFPRPAVSGPPRRRGAKSADA